jgi:succinate-acetate transporter protein
VTSNPVFTGTTSRLPDGFVHLTYYQSSRSALSQVRQPSSPWSLRLRVDHLCSISDQCWNPRHYAPQSCGRSRIWLWRSCPATRRHVVCLSLIPYYCLLRIARLQWSREMAVGNTFGATALSSYGGFWLSFAIVLTPGFAIETDLVEYGPGYFYNSFGLYLMGWFIFTTILLICTLRSTVAFFMLFFTLDLAFLLLGVGYLNYGPKGPQSACIKAGGYFGLFAAFLAWYNALAGIADNSNRSVISTMPHLITFHTY